MALIEIPPIRAFSFMQNEIWKDIPEFEGYYQVSNLGNLRSLSRTILREGGRKLNLKGKIILPKIDEHGYYKCQLWKNNKPKSIRVHRLVAKAFLNKSHWQNHVNHIDGNKLNNNLSNIEWCTDEYNQSESIRLGLKKCQKINKLRNGIIVAEYISISQAARESNIDKSNIYRFLKGEFSQTKGFTWELT